MSPFPESKNQAKNKTSDGARSAIETRQTVLTLGTLANANLTEGEKDVSKVTADTLVSYKYSETNLSDGIVFGGATLTLAAQLKMKVFFTADANATVKINGKTAEKLPEGDEYYVELMPYGPTEFDSEYVIEISDDSGTATVTLSVLSAAYEILSGGTLGTEFENLARALYLYHEAAKTYNRY